ncbi:hypothetical protein H0H81_006536 [Sphagnurus paluster]|uniref:Peptidase M20 domain-containing protein 2 n=1 Tax=Sphagnurus paluster TaxID=117069 RepID=A0A9P7FT97_9AGAR|nr:hypothetical protein H0H81_006536 [Sphagnurus paluster]
MTGCGCQFANSGSGPVWHPDDGLKPAPTHPEGSKDIYRPDILESIEATIKELDQELRALSLDIHALLAHPELRFEERYAHDALTTFMAKHGFEVEKHYHLETAWRATFTHGEGGRTIGVNSEMDALPGVGHACGHNLIAISAEEGGSGKIILLEKGAYEGMSACLMSHPAPGPVGSVSLSSCLALERITVEYHGHTAHAALSPWEGKNALDAAVLGYNNISALRQQLLPTHRVHGIFEGKDWVPNIIPDYAKMICYVRAPTRAELQVTIARVLPCFQGAALASGCEVNITRDAVGTHDLRQNGALGAEVAQIVTAKYGAIDYEWGIKSASTDFGNVGYALPSLHPGFAIPTIKDGGNHTIGFQQAAATEVAHYATLDVTKALAATGVRVLIDDEFLAKVI